jgi:CRP-like cAMP-binding protein
MNALIDYFEKYLPFTVEEKELIVARFSLKNVKRKQMILEDGTVCKHYFFVIKGCFKMYAVDEKGNQHNLQFAAENDWITDISSFHSEKPSKLFIEAIEPSLLLQIEQQDLYFLFINISKLNRIFKVIIENKFVELQNRVLENFSSTALQRYLSFLEQYSNLNNRLPNTQIASYLGITPEFLSKIRKDLTKLP